MRLFQSLVAVIAVLPFTNAFTNPIRAHSGSDPHMVFSDGLYYLMTTTWRNLTIAASPTLEGLKTAPQKVVWKDTNPQRCCNMWAPELHKVEGRWYIYYTAGQNTTDYVPTQRVWVLRGGSESPLSEEYTFAGQITPPNYDQGMLDAVSSAGKMFGMNARMLTSDQTIYEINGKNYFMVSAFTTVSNPMLQRHDRKSADPYHKQFSSTVSPASNMIAALLTPNTTGPSSLLSVPTLEWETRGWAINEGPAGLTSPNGTNHFVFFSASGCNTEYYALGAVLLTPGADPLVTESWTKLPKPFFTTANGLYGPGHNAFFKSPDGKEDWNVFHANPVVDGGCGATRQTFVQRVTWGADGMPVLGTPLAGGTELVAPSGEKKSERGVNMEFLQGQDQI